MTYLAINRPMNNESLPYRMAFYYLNKLRIAASIYSFGHEHSEYALRLFDQEWPQMQQCWAWAKTHCFESPQNAHLCVQYSLASRELLALRLDPQHRITWLKTALEAAEFLRDDHVQAAHLYLIAASHYDAGELSQAETYAVQAIKRGALVHDLLNTGSVLELLGKVHYMMGNFTHARDYFEQSMAIVQTLGDRRLIGRVIKGFGLISWRTGDWKGAHQLLSEALEIARAEGQEIDICDGLIDLSLPTFVLGDVQTARELIEECIRRCRATNYHRVLASSYNTLGQMEADRTKSLHYFKEAVSICRRTGISWNITSYLNNISFALCESGQYTEALKHADESLTLSRATGKHLAAAYSLSNLVEIYAQLGHIQKSCLSLREALEITRETDSSVVKLHMLIRAMTLWDRLGKAEQVAEWAGLMLSLPICVSQEREHLQKLCISLEAKLGTAVFNAALAHGKTRTLDGVMEDVLRELNQILQQVQPLNTELV